MKALVSVGMKDGRKLKRCETTRDDLRRFFKKHHEEILWLKADINLKRYHYYAFDGGVWFRQSLFDYVPNQPERWYTDDKPLLPLNENARRAVLGRNIQSLRGKP